MRRNPYIKELGRIMSAPAKAAPSTFSREEAEAAIAAISERLKGPLHNAERLELVEARRELRQQLAESINKREA